MYLLTIEDHFSSAHQLRGYKGKCENLHGHNWRVELTVAGNTLDATGLLIDFHDLKRILKAIMNDLDHININDHAAFREQNPSSENLARYIFEQIDAELQKTAPQAKAHTVTVYESATSRCTWIADQA